MSGMDTTPTCLMPCSHHGYDAHMTPLWNCTRIWPVTPAAARVLRAELHPASSHRYGDVMFDISCIIKAVAAEVHVDRRCTLDNRSDTYRILTVCVVHAPASCYLNHSYNCMHVSMN